MDPDSVKSTLSNLPFGNVMAAALSEGSAAGSRESAGSSVNQKVDLDKEAEKLKMQGNGEYTEADILGEVKKFFVTFTIESSTVARSKCMEKMGAGNRGQDQ